MIRILAFLFCLLSMVACRSTRKISTAIARKDSMAVQAPGHSGVVDSTRFIRDRMAAVRASHIDYRSFSAKVNIDYSTSDGKKYDVNATVRMIKDSAVWISANAVLGIEALRVLITRDSVKIMNKLDKTIVLRSVDYLQEVSALPLDLSAVQDLIIGNAVFFDTARIKSYSANGAEVSLLSISSWYRHLLTLASDGSPIRSRLDDADPQRSRRAELDYSNWETRGGGARFATGRQISISEKKKLNIKLDFRNYDWNPEVSLPFSIPKNFARQ